MARTRGASTAFHQDDGEVLDKWGKTIPPTPIRGAQHMAPNPHEGGLSVQHMDDGELGPAPAVEAVPIAPIAYEWLCDRTTWHKNMSGYEAILLLDMYMGGLAVTLSPEVQSRLPADVRQHFRRVVKNVEE